MHRISRLRISDAMVVPLIALLSMLSFTAAPARADTSIPATSTHPFATADARAYCDYAASCSRLEAGASASSGALLVDLAAQGTTTLESGACGQMGFPVVCPPPYLTMTGAHGDAWLMMTQTLPTTARSVAFSVTVKTEAAKASGHEASGTLSASAAPGPGSCTDCSGSANVQVVDGLTQPSAPADTRTLSFVYRSASGNAVPPGPINVKVELSGEAIGAGSSSVQLPASVVSIASAVQA